MQCRLNLNPQCKMRIPWGFCLQPPTSLHTHTHTHISVRRDSQGLSMEGGLLCFIKMFESWGGEALHRSCYSHLFNETVNPGQRSCQSKQGGSFCTRGCWHNELQPNPDACSGLTHGSAPVCWPAVPQVHSQKQPGSFLSRIPYKAFEGMASVCVTLL